MRFHFPVLTLVGFLAAQSALAAPMFCREGEPSGATTGFFVPNPQDPGHKCPVMNFGCVDFDLCPKPVPMLCPEGSHFMTATLGYFSVDAERNLSCPRQVGACVKDDLCPQLAPVRCDDGRVQVVVKGFFKIGRKLSCPRVEMACVAERLCPMY